MDKTNADIDTPKNHAICGTKWATVHLYKSEFGIALFVLLEIED